MATRLDSLCDDGVHAGRRCSLCVLDGPDLMEDLYARRVSTLHMNGEGLADVEAANPFRLPRLHPGIRVGGPGAALIAMDLREVVIKVSTDWRRVGGDSNLLDVMFQAHRIVKALGIGLPTGAPTKDVGVRLVEITSSPSAS